MASYLIIHHTHQAFDVALFINNELQKEVSHDKKLASKLLISVIDQMLAQHAITLKDLSFIGVNQGPGLFSTLRSIISTVNALHYATDVPLIGIDGLDAIFTEFYNPRYTYTAVILDACNNEVYYAIAHKGTILSKGYNKIDLFLDTLLQQTGSDHIHFVGNAVNMYKDLIKNKYANLAIIPDTIPSLCCINTIAQLALKKFKTNQHISEYLFPLHLKKHPVEMQ